MEYQWFIIQLSHDLGHTEIGGDLVVQWFEKEKGSPGEGTEEDIC